MVFLWVPIVSYGSSVVGLSCPARGSEKEKDLFLLCVSVCDVLLCMRGCVCVIVCVHV